jgi:hypothetical protein
MYKKRKSKMFADGGIMQEGGTVDEVSGNDVPPGSLKEEVRDDVDAKLSVGEYVFPADVTRYYGIAKLEAMRKEAQDSLKQMEAGGRMGNAEQVSEEAIDSYDNDEEFSKSVDAAMSEQDGENEYNKGGVVKSYAPGGSVGYDPVINKGIYKRAPIKGFEMIPMEDDKGNRIFIPFINGEPQLAIPVGYHIRAASTDTTPTKGTTPTGPDAQQGDAGGGQDSAGGGQDSAGGGGNGRASPSGPDVLGLGPASDRSSWRDSLKDISPVVTTAASFVPGLSLGLNLAKLADFALSSYEKSQNVEANEKMSLAKEAFQKSEKSIIAETIDLSISKNISPNEALDEVYGRYVDDSNDRLSFNGPTVGGPISQPSITGTDLPPVAVSSPVSQSFVTGTDLPPVAVLGGTFDTNAAFAAQQAQSNPNFARDSAYIEASRAAYSAAPEVEVGGPIAPNSLLLGESLPTMATDTIGQYAYMGDSGLQSGGLGQTGLYGDAEAGVTSTGGGYDSGYEGGDPGGVGDR